jgi:hypothetical protein
VTGFSHFSAPQKDSIKEMGGIKEEPSPMRISKALLPPNIKKLTAA